MANATETAQRAQEPDTTEQPEKLPDSAMHTVSHMLGDIVWLMSQSLRHKHFSLADLEWMVMPALLLRQYRILRTNGMLVGVVFGAFLSEESEAKLLFEPWRLRPKEWKSEHPVGFWRLFRIYPQETASSLQCLKSLKCQVLKDKL